MKEMPEAVVKFLELYDEYQNVRHKLHEKDLDVFLDELDVRWYSLNDSEQQIARNFLRITS